MNWKNYYDKHLSGIVEYLPILGILIGGYLVWIKPKDAKGFFWFFEPQTQSVVRPTPPKPPEPETTPTAQPQKFKPFRPLPLTLEQANGMLRAGKYKELVANLRLDQRYAKGADLERITKMLAGLEKAFSIKAPLPPIPRLSSGQ